MSSISPSLLPFFSDKQSLLILPRLSSSSSSSSEAVLVYTASPSSAAPASSRSRNLTREGAARPEILALTLVACSFLLLLGFFGKKKPRKEEEN